jgi:hypothetical protein
LKGSWRSVANNKNVARRQADKAWKDQRQFDNERRTTTEKWR